MSTRLAYAAAFVSLLSCVTAFAQSIRITEVMANPNLTQGGQRAGEFVELFNLSEEPVDLTGWKIGDRDTEDEIVAWRDGDVPKLAGLSFAVIFDPDMTDGYTLTDESVLWLRPLNAAIGNGLALLDPLRLIDAAGVVVDTFTPPKPARSGVSFERRDFMEADSEANWRLTRDRSGSTLGALSSAEEPAEEPEPPVPAASVVVISEILYNPKVDAPEWIELRSLSDVDGTLVGWTLADALAQPVAIPVTTLPAQGYAVLTSNVADFRHAHPSLPQSIVIVEMPLPSLNDAGDSLVVKAADGSVVDEMKYGALLPDDGRSLERRDLEGDSGAMDNWLLAVATSGSTPGEVNSVIHATGPEPIIQSTGESFVADAGQAEFRYEAPMAARVTLLILSQDGELTRTLLHDTPNGGRQSIVWNGHDDDGETVEPGIYVAQLLVVTDGRPRAASTAIIVEAKE